MQQLLRVDWLEGSLDARQAFTGAAMTALAALYAASPAAAHSLRHIPALVLDQVKRLQSLFTSKDQLLRVAQSRCILRFGTQIV